MWPNPQETADLVTFTEETLDGKLYFLCSGNIPFHAINLFLYSLETPGGIEKEQ